MPDQVGLVRRTVELVEACRRAGLPVSLSESIDAARALTSVDLIDREALRAGLKATTVKRAAHQPAFDTLFDLYFPPVYGGGVLADEAAESGEDPPDAAAMRAQLEQLLLDGDDADLERLARQAVALLGRADSSGGRQSFFSYRVMRALSPDTLVAGLLRAMLGEEPPGGLAEQVARSRIRERLRRFEELVDAEVRRRLAEEKGPEQLAKTAVRPLPEDIDFVRASAADLAELRRAVLPLARRLATRLAARRRLGQRGRLDFRRTVRASLATGGVPVVTRHKPPRPHRPELVILCDVSGSVSAFARFTLMLSYALREQFTKVRAFAFIDTCDEVTDMFAGGDFTDAMQRLGQEANLVRFDGHSDYGHSIETFADTYPDAIGPRTSLLILGDARNNYRATGVHTLRRLAGQARHTYWLNPEQRSYWNSGDSVVREYETVVDEMVECRNVTQLSAFIERLLPA